ncbi:MAG: hypothetical protein EX271_05540 [Acidimicrobiales bacterium]|nr:DUF4846 domain-containing protein [Hyphomonadaceae bacterium]RZV42592.1 MAG: hypothetical protein EX271_05540 [Acidimicrobiales bacterium]
MRPVIFKIFLGLAVILCAICVPAIAQVSSSTHAYSWLSSYDSNQSIENRIAPPAGYERTACASGSFCDWLRNLQLKQPGSPVLHYDGTIKHGAASHAVIDIDTGKKDLQQCADAVMRLKAEYHYGQQEFNRIHFNFTSGHKVSFNDWRRGKKPIVSGNKVKFSGANSKTDNSYGNFKKYMTIIFSYAGTLSLSKEMKSVDIADIRVGDVFVWGGSPGHAVLVIDVAKNDAGQKMFMLAQSYMPAQDMHILTNPFHPGEGPWYSAEFENELFTPEWRFVKADLKRF